MTMIGRTVQPFGKCMNQLSMKVYDCNEWTKLIIVITKMYLKQLAPWYITFSLIALLKKLAPW